jgi:hypothetical protein
MSHKNNYNDGLWKSTGGYFLPQKPSTGRLPVDLRKLTDSIGLFVVFCGYPLKNQCGLELKII